MRVVAAVLASLLIAASALAAAPQKMSIKDTRKGYELDVSYPRFGHAAMDRELETWARAIAQDFREGARESTGDPNP